MFPRQQVKHKLVLKHCQRCERSKEIDNYQGWWMSTVLQENVCRHFKVDAKKQSKKQTPLNVVTWVPWYSWVHCLTFSYWSDWMEVYNYTQQHFCGSPTSTKKVFLRVVLSFLYRAHTDMIPLYLFSGCSSLRNGMIFWYEKIILKTSYFLFS